MFINGNQSLDDYMLDMPSFERWGDADALDNTSALYDAIAWMKNRGIGHLYFPKKYRFNRTIPFESGVSYNGNGKSTSGFIITHNEDAIKAISGIKYSSEINNLIIQHESLNSPARGICGINCNQLRISNVQVTGFSNGVITGGASYYSSFDRVRVLNCDYGFTFDSGSRGITALDCSTDARINGFTFNAETDLINNISLLNPKAEKTSSNGVGFLFKSLNSKSITGVSALSGRFDPKSTESGQIFIKTESERASNISNIMFIDPVTFNTPTTNMLLGENVFEQVTVLGATLGFGNIKGTGVLVHDIRDLTKAGRIVFYDSNTRPRIEIRNRQNSLPISIRAGNIEAIGAINVNNRNSEKEACISVAECSWEKPFKLGECYIWLDSDGILLKKNGVPTKDDDGRPL